MSRDTFPLIRFQRFNGVALAYRLINIVMHSMHLHGHPEKSLFLSFIQVGLE
jgi:hypothetical protein